MNRTQAQTPAPKGDQIKGSKTNKPSSAAGTRGGIEISESATRALENLRDKHNERYKAKSKKVDLGMLKAVYRRGAGAFSVSHRPGMTRGQWALARVKTFLKLVGTGERKKAYNTDLDLLPKGHPQRTEKKAELLSIPDKYSHIDFVPPKGAQAAAKRALEVRATKPQSQRGMTPVGIARARDLANGKQLSPETVRRMLAYFTRHEVDKKGSTWNNQGKGWQAWNGWGGDPGYSFARRVVNQMNKADEKTKTLRAYGEAIQLSEPVPAYDVPDGLTIGKPFKTLALGQVSSRMNGSNIGSEIDHEMLSEMLRVFNDRKQSDPVIIDWQHATSPFNNGTPAPPESGNALGLIVDLELREDGLYATPAYNERGLDVVKNAGGVLWSSPEFIAGDVYARDGGDPIGTAQLLAITLTPRPAQSNDKIDRVILKERIDMIDNLDSMPVEDLRSMLVAKDEMVRELEAQIAEMQKDAESKMTSEELEENPKKEDEPKAEKLADDDDDEQMTEKTDEKKSYNMSEQLNESTLLSEVQSLREQNVKLSERLEAIEAEKRDVEMKSAVSALLSDGRITPAEEAVASKAWQLKELQPEFWQMFSERASNSAIPLTQVGHGASGAEISKATLDAEVKKLAAEKSITYSEALTQFRTNNPDYYNQAFGG
jgi:phage I-like protein